MAMDTLKYSKHLRGHGFTEDQAEAIAEGMNDSMVGDLVTKKDLELAMAGLRNQMWAVGFSVVLALGVIQHFFK